MNTIHVQDGIDQGSPMGASVENLPFEIEVTDHGKQVMGYLGLLTSTLGYPYGDHQYLSVETADNQSLQYALDGEAFQSMKEKRTQTLLDSGEYLYIWIELDECSEIIKWQLFKLPMTLDQFYPVYQACYHFESLYRLIQLGHAIQTAALKGFFWSLFSSRTLMRRFVSIPASKNHHHSFPSGLLIHSLECALIVHRNLQEISLMNQAEKEITVMAALLHDIGKTETLGLNRHTDLGRLVEHESLSLMVLAEPLRVLSHRWEEGARTLQYLLTWKPAQGHCRYVGGNLIRLADHLSTSASLRKMAFENKPDYFHYATWDTGYSRQYLSRLT